MIQLSALISTCHVGIYCDVTNICSPFRKQVKEGEKQQTDVDLCGTLPQFLSIAGKQTQQAQKQRARSDNLRQTAKASGGSDLFLTPHTKRSSPIGRACPQLQFKVKQLAVLTSISKTPHVNALLS